MPKKPFPMQLFVRALVVAGIVGLAVLLNIWRSYEGDRAFDAATLSQYAEIRESLQQYFLAHGQYPPLGENQQSMVVSQTLHCLSDEGFVPLVRESCDKRNYLSHINGRYAGVFLLRPFTYRPIASDGSACASQGGCPGYAIPFELKTNAFFPKGTHIMNEIGVQ